MSRQRYVESEFERWLGYRFYFELIFAQIIVIVYTFSIMNDSQLIHSVYTILMFGLLVMALWIIAVVCILTCEYVVFSLTRYLKKRKDEIVRIEKGNGWVRYYTNEGWSEEQQEGYEI